MSNHLDSPFVWPGSRSLAGIAGPVPNLDAIMVESNLVLGVVHGLTVAGVTRHPNCRGTQPIAG